MKKIKLGTTQQMVPSIIIGCMRIAEMESKQLEKFVFSCIENGANYFDHADIYAGGVCEEKFGEVIKSNKGLREQIFLQSKCGIVPGKMYDLSKEHILACVDQSLKRLGTEYLDMLLLHRPDALMEPEEVADAFDELEKAGKVRHFGVSNQNPMQIQLLKKCVKQPILANQLQLSIPVSNMIASGLEVNMDSEGSVDHDGSVLDYCRLNDITIQAWSPFQKANWTGIFLGSDEYKELNQVLEELAKKYNVSPTMMVTAWMVRHPAHMQMISGTTKIERVKEMLEASEIYITREEWYKIYLAAGHILP